MANETYSEKNETSATNENPWFIGILMIDEDCNEEKVFTAIKEIKVKGKVFCSEAIKKHYGLK